MNRIRLLPETVANQIAAGEVIERPASVVKELVENALDAQAKHLTVDVLAGGRGLVRVTDDGVGMSRDDALLCLERHATSKVQNADDLFRITTMGFRGEALPSIASVSRFTLTTRERDSDSPEATQVIVHGGKLLEVRSAGAPAGTSIEVRQLFYNLPARRKFLRTEETERAHIHHYLTLAALAHPHVAFTFTTDSRTVFQLPAAPPASEPSGQLAALRERLRALHGTELKLLTVDSQGTYAHLPDAVEHAAAAAGSGQSAIRLWGFIGAPGVSRGSRDDQHLFVNRRPIENRALNFALIEGYHTALMKGRYPVACLFLELDPAQVDVNIHPAKREVKFHHERAIRAFVTQAIRDTLLNFHTAPERGLPIRSTPELPAAPLSTEVALTPPAVPSGSAAGTPQRTAPAPASLPDFFPSLPSKPVPNWPASAPQQAPLPMGFGGQQPAVTHHPSPAPAPAPSPLLAVPLRLVGVIGRLYVVLESDRGLVLMDQHAAHERILFEQMLDRLEAGGEADSQRLLLPETVELSVRDAGFLRQQLPILARLGVGLGEFGERTFLLEGLPPFAKVPDARRFVIELVDALKSAGEGVNALRLGEDVIAKTVCRHAVKANDPLAGPELENLVADLRRCRMPYTCPHGRPTLIEMSLKELEKKFGRAQ